ncbi:MAG: N-acetyl-gamma-glutamyl-phosphate reductase [Bacillota bacterium]|nr:N-acetyl-gamma-glutamyl-phosphate reductase [Bacillota bacterium]
MLDQADAVPVKVAVLGATGYTGAELLRLLAGHPGVQVTAATSDSYAGKRLDGIFPHLYPSPLILQPTSAPVGEVAEEAGVVFLCLPHGLAMDMVPGLLEAGRRVVDFGADFRLRDPEAYRQWYGHAHRCPELLGEAVYGIPEVKRREIARARLVANPGCYPTSVILALAPLASWPGVDWRAVVADCKSGVTGAGRGPSLGTHYPEVNDSLRPYNVAGVHRHVPEIEQELAGLAGREVRVAFTPHLVPMSRGMLSVIYLRVEPVPSLDDLYQAYREHYRDEPFVHVLEPGELPATVHVRGTNRCHLAVGVDGRTGGVLVFSAIDNLGKGAAGEAVQNLNVMMGWPEETGLGAPALFP